MEISNINELEEYAEKIYSAPISIPVNLQLTVFSKSLFEEISESLMPFKHSQQPIFNLLYRTKAGIIFTIQNRDVRV